MKNSVTSSGNHMTQRTFALPGQGERKAANPRNLPETEFPQILCNIALPGVLRNTALPGALRNFAFPGILRNTALSLALMVLFSSCITPQYILDNDSAALQKQIHNKRVGNVFGDVFLTAGSTFLAVFTGVFVYSPSGNSLKKVALCNNGADTLQVNMLTDQTWKDSSYADMMDIRIPPGKTARFLLPAGAVYNLYFSNTPGTEEDDEFLVFDTNTMRKVNLYPGLTLPPDSTKIIPEQQNMPQ